MADEGTTISADDASKKKGSAPSVSAGTHTGAEKPQPSAEERLFSGNVIEEAAKKAAAPAPVPTTQPVSTEQPDRNMREMGMAPRPNIEQPQSAAQGKPAVVSPDTGLPHIRTYAADMSEEIRKRGETLSSIINAEQQKMGRTYTVPQASAPVPQQEGFGRALLVASAGFLVLGVVAIIAALFLFGGSEDTPTPRPSIIAPNTLRTVEVPADADLMRLLSSAREATAINLGEIEEVGLVARDGSFLSPESILAALGAPAGFARNATEIMVGLHAFNHTQPFILIRVSAYDLAFQGMLQWEDTLARDLGSFFAPATGGTSRPPALTFSDRVHQNIDIRQTGAEWPILYAFIEKNLLIITTNESTLREVLTRLSFSSGGF